MAKFKKDTPAEAAEDRRQAKKRGISPAAYEKLERAGKVSDDDDDNDRIKVVAHTRARKAKPAPAPAILPAPAPGEDNDDYQSDLGDGGF